MRPFVLSTWVAVVAVAATAATASAAPVHLPVLGLDLALDGDWKASQVTYQGQPIDALVSGVTKLAILRVPGPCSARMADIVTNGSPAADVDAAPAWLPKTWFPVLAKDGTSSGVCRDVPSAKLALVVQMFEPGKAAIGPVFAALEAELVKAKADALAPPSSALADLQAIVAKKRGKPVETKLPNVGASVGLPASWRLLAGGAIEGDQPGGTHDRITPRAFATAITCARGLVPEDGEELTARPASMPDTLGKRVLRKVWTKETRYVACVDVKGGVLVLEVLSHTGASPHAVSTELAAILSSIVAAVRAPSYQVPAVKSAHLAGLHVDVAVAAKAGVWQPMDYSTSEFAEEALADEGNELERLWPRGPGYVRIEKTTGACEPEATPLSGVPAPWTATKAAKKAEGAWRVKACARVDGGSLDVGMKLADPGGAAPLLDAIGKAFKLGAK